MAIGNIGKIQLYTGPIYKVFADDFVLDKHGRPSCVKKHKIEKKNANFYIGDGKGGEYENLEYGCVLAQRGVAIEMCDDAIKVSKPTIMGAFRKEDPKEQHRILEQVKIDSECLYYDPTSLKPSEKITKKELVKRIKLRDEINAKNKNKKK